MIFGRNEGVRTSHKSLFRYPLHPLKLNPFRALLQGVKERLRKSNHGVGVLRCMHVYGREVHGWWLFQSIVLCFVYQSFSTQSVVSGFTARSFPDEHYDLMIRLRRRILKSVGSMAYVVLIWMLCPHDDSQLCHNNSGSIWTLFQHLMYVGSARGRGSGWIKCLGVFFCFFSCFRSAATESKKIMYVEFNSFGKLSL